MGMTHPFAHCALCRQPDTCERAGRCSATAAGAAAGTAAAEVADAIAKWTAPPHNSLPHCAVHPPETCDHPDECRRAGCLITRTRALERDEGLREAAHVRISPKTEHEAEDVLTPPEAWHATFVRRWHAGTAAPYLAHTGDTIGWHGARMAVLARYLWPRCSAELVFACVAHDLGEYLTGDLPQSFKLMMGDVAEELADAEAQVQADMGMGATLHPGEKDRLRFLDRLDAYLWMQHHAPQLASRQEWRDARKWLVEQAEAHGIAGKMRSLSYAG